MADRSTMALRLPPDAAASLRLGIGRVAEQVIAAIISEVPSYRDPFKGSMGRNIETAVRVALDGFLELAARREGIDAGEQIETVLLAAYELGKGEARSGRTMDALAQAYRVGARVSWRELSTEAVALGLEPTLLARLAELVFAYIDELSDASVSGHADELAATGRARQRRLEQLAARLVAGGTEEALRSAATLADWEPPAYLAAVVLTDARLRAIRQQLDPRTLTLADDVVDLRADQSILLVPLASAAGRRALLRLAGGEEALVGPARTWSQVRTSYSRVLTAHRLGLQGDTETQLATLVCAADAEAHANLRDQVLEPLASLTPAAREKLAVTLRAWLLHQGRREDIAAALFVHPQTVRYRVGQLREAYGDRLTDPEFIRAATIALG